jgi:hypothetical protein
MRAAAVARRWFNGTSWGTVNLDLGRHACYEPTRGYNEHGDRMDFSQGGWNVVWLEGQYTHQGEQWVDTKVDGLTVALRLHDDALAALQTWWKPQPWQEAERAAARQQAVERLSGWAAAQQAACTSNDQPASSGTYFLGCGSSAGTG